MLEDLRITDSVVIPDGELRERFSRSSGPGGQSVNTADSRVELSFDIAATQAFSESQRRRVLGRVGQPTITIVASEHRGQLANRRSARERLAALLRSALQPPPPARRATRPSVGARQRRLDEKRRRSSIKRNRDRPDDA